MSQNIDKSFEDGEYVYYSKPTGFKKSGYAYSGTYAETAVYSVEFTSEDSIGCYTGGGWSYNLGIIMTQGDFIDGSINQIYEYDIIEDPAFSPNYRSYDNPGNEFYGVTVSLGKDALRTHVGPLMHTTGKIAHETGVGGNSNPHSRILTVVLQDNILYYYVDGIIVTQESVTSSKYKFMYTDDKEDLTKFNVEFVENKPIMFGVDFTNVENSGIKARIVTEKYGNEARDYIASNFAEVK